ncbi:proton channel OtopLc-like isoform X2 [Gigantopelta aegis]|nr:proton channel OtopLc-like isoform X2 [Gigantopelta aegis]
MRSGTYIVNEPQGTDNGLVSGTDQEVVETKMANEPVEQQQQQQQQQQQSEQTKIKPREKTHSVYKSAITKLLCGLYCLLLVVFGIVFSIANALTVKEREHKYYLEIFLIYLYLVALVILLYFQIWILRGVKLRQNYFDTNLRVVIRRSQDNIQLSPGLGRKGEDQQAEDPADADRKQKDSLERNQKELLDHVSTDSIASVQSQFVVPGEGQVAHVGEGINFYLRLGALAFSIGSVTLDGFHIASYFETDNTSTCESEIYTVVYVLHLIFTFVQTFFLFKNHKLVIDKNKASVRFGLMHLLAANMCVWFVTAVTETSEDFRQQDFDYRLAHNISTRKSCYEEVTLARTASPYLFPSTIIYSIIAAGIIYRMYTYVGVKVTQRWPSHTSLTSSVPHGAASMDCEKANKGLFTGLLIAVITLIAIATFFVFESRLKDPVTAIQVFFILEITLLLITGCSIIFGHIRLAELRFQENFFLSLDSVLLVISLGGAYCYLAFMLISAGSMISSFGLSSILSLVVICVALIQTTMQAIFILDGLCRCAENDTQVERKPGRSLVTFMLVCNLALWVVSMFEIKKTMVVPFHERFYGILSWNVMLHTCVPLFIYFRFHSAICLSKMWYQCYQKEKMI